METLNSIINIRRSLPKYKKWEEDQNDQEAKRQVLHKTVKHSPEELKEAEKCGKTMINAISVMDAYSEDKTQDVETTTGLIFSFVNLIGIFLPLGVAFPFISNKHKKLNKEFQNKKNELLENFKKENPNIVSTNVEQEIKKITFANPNSYSILEKSNENKIPESLKTKLNELLTETKKEKRNYFSKISLKLISSMLIGSAVIPIVTILYSTHLQKEAARIARYQAREKELKDPQNFVIYTDEQINEAKKIAPNIKIEEKNKVKKLDVLGLIDAVKSIRSLINDNKNYQNWKKHNIDDLCQNPSAESLEKAKLDQDVILRVTNKINNTAEDYAQNTEASAGILLESSMIGGAIIGKIISYLPGMSKVNSQISDFAINNFLHGKVNAEKRKFIKNNIMSGIVGFATTLITLQISLKLQKEATRIGRFKAKQELLQDPLNFIAYSDEQMETVKDVKSENKKRNFLQRMWDNFIFIPKAIQYEKEYSNYKKTELKEEKQLRKALKQVKITPEQLNEAKNTQHKLFKTFERIDEMSQRYSEDMEAFNDTLQQTLPNICTSVIGMGILYTISLFRNGNKAKAVNNIVNILSKGSTLFKTKIGKKFLSEIESGITQNIKEAKSEVTKKGNIKSNLSTAEISINKENLLSDINKLKNKINNLNEDEIKKYLLTDDFKNNLNNLNNDKFNKDKFIISEKDLKYLNKKRVIHFINNCTKIIQNIPEQNINRIMKQITDLQSENNEAFNIFLQKSSGIIINTPTARKFYYGNIIGSIVGLVLLMNYFADIQKKASRVGVMKAMESLKDPRYFVDKYPE